MSNFIKSKTGAYFLSQFDFAGAIAACNAAIALTQATVDNIDDHICRAYAYCFAVEKNSANYDKAIADCSIALSVLGQKYSPKNGTVLRVRALAYYLKGDYASALSDCNWVLDKPNADYSDNEDKSFVREILAKIHLNMQKYEAAIIDCGDFILCQSQPVINIFPTLGATETYCEACEKLRDY